MRDDTAEARIFGVYRRLADARRSVEQQLDDPINLLSERQRHFLNAEKRRIGDQMVRLSNEIAEAAAIAIVG